VAGHPRDRLRGGRSLRIYMSNSSVRHSGMRRRDKIAKLFCAEGTDPESIMPQRCWEKWILRCATAHRSSRLRAPRNDEHYFGAHLGSRGTFAPE
jgi:hypothetical protein